MASGRSVGELFLAVKGDLDELEKQLTSDVPKAADKAGAAAGQTFGKKFSDTLKKNLPKVLGVSGAGIGAFVADSVQQFARFDDQMREVFSIMPGITAKAMDEMKAQVKGLSVEYGILTDDLIPALGTAIGSGIPERNVMSFMEVAAKAAKAGATDAETSVRALSATINAFQIPVEDANKVADSFFNAIDKGVTTFPELANNMSQVSPVAAALGLDLEEVLAAVTTMTLQGTPTAQAITAITSSLTSLQRTTPEMARALKNLGFETGQALLEAEGYQGAMEALRGEADRMGVPLIKLTGRLEGQSAILQTTGKNAAKAREILGTFGDTAGKVDAAFEVMEGGIGGASRRIAAQVRTMMVDIGAQMAEFGPLFVAFGPQMGRLLGASIGGLVGLVSPVVASTFLKLGGVASASMLSALGLSGGVLSASSGLVPGVIAVLRALAVSPLVLGAASAAGVAIGFEVLKAIWEQTGGPENRARARAEMQAFADELGVGIEEVIRAVEQIARPRSGVIEEWFPKVDREKLRARILENQRTIQQEAAQFSPLKALVQSLRIDTTEGGAEGLDDGYANWLIVQWRAGQAKALERNRAVAAEGARELSRQHVRAWVGSMGAIGPAIAKAFSGAVAEGVAAAREKALTLGPTIRNGIRSQIDEVRSAMADLRWAIEHPFSDIEQAAYLSGKLHSKSLRKGLASENPAIRREARDVRDYLVANIRGLTDETSLQAFLASKELERGLKSKDPKVRQHWRDVRAYAKRKLREMREDASSGGTDQAAAYATALVTRLGTLWKNLTAPDGIVARIAGIFGGSLPEYGPLVGVEKGGASLVDAWVANAVAAARGGSRELMGAMAGFATPFAMTPAWAGASSLTANTTVRHVHELAPGSAQELKAAGFDDRAIAGYLLASPADALSRWEDA